MKKRILVTGSQGQLGSCIKEISDKYTEFEFIFTDITELDITSYEEVTLFIQENKPDWVINTAAYNAVDKAETETQKALLLNANAVEYLSEATKNINAGLVQLSTDYVFRGDNQNCLTETDSPSPISVYGITKLQGELEAEKNPKHIIIRTSWLYSIYGNNFVKTMQKLGKEKDELNIVSDQWGNPTSAHDLANVILEMIKNPSYGIFHYSNEGTTSWAIFAETIMEYSNINCKINYITSSEYPSDANRPEFSIMSKDKIKKYFGIKIPEWEYSLEEVIAKMTMIQK